MDLGPISSSLTTANFRAPASFSSGRSAAVASTGASDLATLLQRSARTLGRLRNLGEIFETARLKTRPLGEAVVRSAAPLGLSTEAAPALLVSSGEVNAVPTSWGPEQPDFVGSSTASPTLAGTYEGGVDDTLTFTVTQGGLVGFFSPLEIEVTDSEGGVVDTVTIPPLSPPGQSFALSNGLEVSFAFGTLVQGDSFEVEVSASVGSAVDPERAFDEDPGFEDGVVVTAGQFEVNGVAVEVLADDSVASVLARINASAAGVVATFDAASERVVLTSEQTGSDAELSLGSDSSGFLEAVKLDDAVPVAGRDDELEAALAEVPAFAGISSGALRVQGVEVAVDPLVDSLRDVLERIEAATEGVTAVYEEGAGRVSIGLGGPGALELEDEGTGLLAALGLAEGRFEGGEGRTRINGLRRQAANREIRALAEELNTLFEQLSSTISRAETGRLRDGLRGALVDFFDRRDLERRSDGAFDLGVGLSFDLSSRAPDVLRFDEEAFARNLASRPGALVDLLRGEGRDRGLFDSLAAALQEAGSALSERTGGGSGSLLNRLA